MVRAESNITRFVKARNVWLPGVVEPGTAVKAEKSYGVKVSYHQLADSGD